MSALAAVLAIWRVAFLALHAAIAGAVVLLCVARLTGADWDAALRPLARRAWLLAPAFLPLVVQQASFVPLPPHLTLWMAWPAFAARGLLAIALWAWLARMRPGPLGSGLGLVAHGIAVTIVGTDWLLGTAPSQPNSAIGMVMATMQVLGASAAACLLRLGPERIRRDLALLLLAACLGLAYLLFIDFLIVWFGDLPARVGWYAARAAGPWGALPPIALAVGLFLPIAATVLARRRLAGGAALAGLVVALAWVTGA